MTLQSGVEWLLAAAGIALLARDLYRAWRDPLYRPVTLFVGGLMVVLLAGTAGRAHPRPEWLLVPAAILVWEVTRGWRRTPRCHLWEAGVGAFAVAIVLAAAGLGVAGAAALLPLAVAAAALGLALLALSRRREPRPSRPGDVKHYERRSTPRP